MPLFILLQAVNCTRSQKKMEFARLVRSLLSAICSRSLSARSITQVAFTALLCRLLSNTSTLPTHLRGFTEPKTRSSLLSSCLDSLRIEVLEACRITETFSKAFQMSRSKWLRLVLLSQELACRIRRQQALHRCNQIKTAHPLFAELGMWHRSSRMKVMNTHAGSPRRPIVCDWPDVKVLASTQSWITCKCSSTACNRATCKSSY